MLWSLLKIFVFLAIAVGLAFGAAWIIETPGEVTLAFAGREFNLSPIGFVIAVAVVLVLALLVLKVIGLLVAVARFLLGDETAVSRYFSRSRERRGFNALSDGMVALAAGDTKRATKKAARADKLLRRPDVTRLLSAQAAEQSGDRARALECNKELLTDDRTRFVGLQGLIRLKLAEGDKDTALALLQKAFALRPDNEWVLRTLFDLQSARSDWSGARATLNATTHARLLPRDVGSRRDAVLSLADAQAALAAGDTPRGQEAALQANKIAPTLIPAAALAGRIHAERGAKRKASRVLTSAWSANPHPDIAASYAAIEPDEAPAARRKRFEALAGAAPDHAESRLLRAELALADEDFPAARKALGDLPETEPTTRSLALMTAVERGQGAPEAVVRGWLAKALGASRGPQWICGKCNQIHTSWEPVCDNCGAFDTIDWRTAPHVESTGIADSAMLPLIIGSDDRAGGEAAAGSTEIEDAEVADEPVATARGA